MNEEQKIWIVGSYYHYSVGEGFDEIEGYDLFNSNGQMVFDKIADDGAYVVHAKRQILPDVGATDFVAYDFILGSLHGLKYLESDDKKFNALRLAADYDKLDTHGRGDLLKNLNKLEDIYEIIHVMKEMIIPAPVKAMLANFLYPVWTNSAEQKAALSQGLGLSPADDFWTSVSKNTGAMSPRQKVIFLSNLVPFFGTKSDKVSSYPELLEKAVDSIQKRLPDEALGSVQDFASDFLIADFLLSDKPDAANRALRYIDSLTTEQLKALVIEDRQNSVR